MKEANCVLAFLELHPTDSTNETTLHLIINLTLEFLPRLNERINYNSQ